MNRRRRPSAAQRMAQRRPLAPGPGFLALPPPLGRPPFRRRLTTGDPELVRFHAVGDTGGHRDPTPQRRVAAAMSAEGADFLFHLGDVVYPHGEADHYPEQFDAAYADYPGPIFGVPGNHDAENGLETGELALAPFLAHFGSERPRGRAARPAVGQPNLFFTLEHPLVRIVGLWANRPEGGQFASDQIAWLTGELRAAPLEIPVLLALHQPVLSADVTHGGNLDLLDLLDGCAREAGRGPDAVLSGHAHLYERFAAPLGGRTIPVIVAGAGGYPELHPVAAGVGPLPARFAGLPGVTLEHVEDRVHGYLAFAVRRGAGSVEARYTTAGPEGPRTADVFAVTTPGRS